MIRWRFRHWSASRCTPGYSALSPKPSYFTLPSIYYTAYPELSLAEVLGEAVQPLRKLLHELLAAQLASLLPSPAQEPTT